MKKTFWTMWLLVAAGVGFVACRGGDAEGFETADLPADSLTVEGFSGYTSWMRQGDKVVVYTLPGDTNFSVYRLPEFEPLYDFAVEPRKPGSFFYAAGLFPDGVQDSVLYVFSLQERFLSRVLLGKDTARVEERFPGAPKVVYANGILLADTLVLAGTMNFLEKSHSITLLDPRGWDTLQSLDSKTILDERFNAVNYPFFAFSKGRLVLAYKNYKRLEYYALSPEGRLDFVRAVGKDYDRRDVAEMKEKRTPMDGPVDVAWGENHLYLLENAVNKRGELLASRVEVFDWEGNGLYRLHLERPATKLLVDEAGERLYAIRPALDSSRVYRYDLGRFAR